MSEVLWVRSHVRQLMSQVWERCCVEVDEDGDVPFRYGTAKGWVSVREADDCMVRVSAIAAIGVKSSMKLLRELNELQHGTVSVRVENVDGYVLVSQTISPIGLTAPVLLQALSSVSCVADDNGALIAAMFGGATPYEAEVDVDEETPGPF